MTAEQRRVRPGDLLCISPVDEWRRVLRVTNRWTIPVAVCVGPVDVELDDDAGYPLSHWRPMEDIYKEASNG